MMLGNPQRPKAPAHFCWPCQDCATLPGKHFFLIPRINLTGYSLWLFPCYIIRHKPEELGFMNFAMVPRGCEQSALHLPLHKTNFSLSSHEQWDSFNSSMNRLDPMACCTPKTARKPLHCANRLKAFLSSPAVFKATFYWFCCWSDNSFQSSELSKRW